MLLCGCSSGAQAQATFHHSRSEDGRKRSAFQFAFIGNWSSYIKLIIKDALNLGKGDAGSRGRDQSKGRSERKEEGRERSQDKDEVWWSSKNSLQLIHLPLNHIFKLD